ncbi:MAG: zinc metallopeptidase [Ketobacteraceae bacterium]|nr:zinc metallopeptidase [Ketobacteraceae bacterium]
MIYVLGSLAIIALIVGPGIWAQYVLKRYSKASSDYPYSGRQFAQRLIDQFKLKGVRVEKTKPGTDHYDPIDKCVRISETYYDQPSLTAMTVAAHEVGHAIQDYTAHRGLRSRLKLVQLAEVAGKVGNGALIAAPILGILSRSPGVAFVVFGLAFLGFFMMVLVHMVTLPVEIDASFNRALPIMKDAGYLEGQDLQKARRILKACALTYVAQSLLSLLQLHRFFRR